MSENLTISITRHFVISKKYAEKLTQIIGERLNIDLKFSILTNIIDIERLAHKNGIDTKPIWADHIKEETGLTPEEYVASQLNFIRDVFQASSKKETQE